MPPRVDTGPDLRVTPTPRSSAISASVRELPAPSVAAWSPEVGVGPSFDTEQICDWCDSSDVWCVCDWDGPGRAQFSDDKVTS